MAAADRRDPSSGLRVRATRDGDQPLLRSLRIAALTDAPEAFCSSLERERTRDDWDRWVHPGGTFVLEDADGALVGLACGTPGRGRPGAMFVESVWIAPGQRGRGGADLLIEAVLGWGRAAGYREALLHVGDRSPAARACYERHGFRATGGQFVRGPAGIVETELALALD